MRPLTIVQARMGSTRLPGKVLADIGGLTTLEHVIRQITKCDNDTTVVIATTDLIEDEVVLDEARRQLVFEFAGDVEDVLGRFAQCHKIFEREFEYPIVVRITADSPFLDPHLLDQTIDLLTRGGYDYVGTDAPAGVGQEAFTAEILHAANRWAKTPDDREHVVPWMIRNGNCGWVHYDGPQEPLALDTPEDLERLRARVAA